MYVYRTYWWKKKNINYSKITSWKCNDNECVYELRKIEDIIGSSTSTYKEKGFCKCENKNEEFVLSTKLIIAAVISRPNLKLKKIYDEIINEYPQAFYNGISYEEKGNLLGKIYNYKYNNKENAKKSFITNTADLFEYLERNHIKNFNTEKFIEDVLIVLDYDLGDGSEDDPFTIIFSSYTFLKNAITQAENNNKCALLGLDATYKLNSLSYPLLVLGTQDLQHHTFPLCFSIISSNES